MWYLSQKFSLLIMKQNNITISQWLDKVLTKGAYGFSIELLHRELPEYSDIAIKRSLNRLSRNKKIVSLYKGYYLIIPPQYAAKGILPPQLYLDAFMKHLQRPYYVALLNAAAYHGASHQQPQEYFVITGFPVLRATQKKGQRINYISIKDISGELIEKKKTEAGYLNVSNAALTACDLVQFEKRVGGINRVAMVLNELAEVIQPPGFSKLLLQHSHVTALQRLGYLLEEVCHQPELADALYQAVKNEKLTLYRIPLKPSSGTKGFFSDNRWKVIVNTEIEIDE
jgi:predicted transcriptional regulator of viral defense system